MGGICANLKPSRQWYAFLAIFIGIFLCFGYMTGSDWREYELIYNEIELDHLFRNYYNEPGYYLYMVVFRILHIDFWHFFILTKLIIYSSFILFIRKYYSQLSILTLLVFFSSFSLFYFINNPMRNMIAVAIFLWAIPYMLKHQTSKAVILLLTAASFHISALLLLFIFPLRERNIKNISFIILYVFCNLIYVFQSGTLSFLGNALGNVPVVGPLAQWYFIDNINDASVDYFSLGKLSKFLFFAQLIYFRKHIEKEKYGKLLFNFSMFFLLFYTVGSFIDILQRFSMYFSIFYCISLVYILKYLHNSIKIFYASYLVLISFVAIPKEITSTPFYVPYSNYLEYIFQEKPDYSERYNYNLQNSPYQFSDN